MTPSQRWVAAAVGLAALGVLLAVVAGAVSPRFACESEQLDYDTAQAKAVIESSTNGSRNRSVFHDMDAKRGELSRCRKSASITSTALGTLAVFSFIGAGGAGILAYTSTSAAAERKRQRAWSRYYAAQQASTPPPPAQEPQSYDYPTPTAEPHVHTPPPDPVDDFIVNPFGIR